MKKSLILLSICSAVLLTSCGTSSYYASSAFEDGIYYRPSGDVREEARADSEEVQKLISRTRQEAARFSDTIVIASANSTVDVPYVPDAQYTLMFDNRLDSLGQVNLNFDFDFYDWYPGYGYRDYYSYWDWRYWGAFGPSWYRWGWHSPWYGWGWYDPWYCGWGFGFGMAWDPWYGPWGGWYAGWYGPGYWGWYDPWYDPWYGPWGYPVASFYPTYAYYGKRNTGLRTGSGVTGSRTLASAGGSSLRSGGRKAAPTMSVVRGSASSGRSTASGRTFQARPTGSGSSVNMGERYVNRGSLRANATSYRNTAGDGRTAYNTGSSFRRPANTATGTASTYRRPATSRSESFRSPFDNRTSFSVSTGRDNTGFSRGTTYNSRSSVSRSSYSNTTRSSFSTGSYSRSSMGGGGRSYGGGGGRSGGGGGRR